MLFHIDTIPIWDAVNIEGECFLCSLRRKIELSEIERSLGASVMDPDSRILVNEKGFCCFHQQMLYAQKNRLGLALMMHSHMKQLKEKVNLLCSNLTKSDSDNKGKSSSFLFNRKKENSSSTLDKLESLTKQCVLCEKIDKNMERYIRTFFHMWKKEPPLKEAIKKSKGICLPDSIKLIRSASKNLNNNAHAEFIGIITDKIDSKFERLEKELEWFTLKFDYRNSDKPWGNSKDALERTINMLRAWCVGDEPNPKDS